MCLNPGGTGEEPAEDYSGSPVRDRLALLAFDARLAAGPPALWEAIDTLAAGNA